MGSTEKSYQLDFASKKELFDYDVGREHNLSFLHLKRVSTERSEHSVSRALK